MSPPGSAMLREILEQPAALERLLEREGPAAERLGRSLRSRPPPLVVLAARGSSDHAAVLGKYLIEILVGAPAALAAPSVATLYRRRLRLKGALVVGVSQSGRSPDIVEYLLEARRAGARTLAVTNESESPLAGACHDVLLCHAGEERSVPATKTFLTQVGALYLLAGAWSAERRLLRGLDRVPDLLRATLKSGERFLDRALEGHRGFGRAVVVGRGLGYPVALEWALKLKEAAGIFAEGLSAADFLHGHSAMVEPRTFGLVLAGPGPGQASLAAAAERLSGQGAELWAFAGGRALSRGCYARASLPAGTTPLLAPFPLTAYGQLLACRLARLRGRDPDRPPGLSKVTRTR